MNKVLVDTGAIRAHYGLGGSGIDSTGVHPEEIAVNGQKADRHREDYEAKLLRLRAWLVQRSADGLLLTTVTNFGWLTHGRSFVSLASEGSVAKVLITADRVVLFTTTNEAPRLEREEVAGWGLELVAWPWYERFETHWQSSGFSSQSILIDRNVEAELSVLRQQLSGHEQELLRQLGAESAELVEQFALGVQPGRRENELAGDLARAAWSAGMEPLVLNLATDERAFAFRHAIPTSRVLERYGVFSVCFRRFGLHVTLTRSVHFGPLPADLAARHLVACTLEASVQGNSVVGAPVKTLVAAMVRDYRELGWPEEWKQHPIGGGLGFQPREFDVTPDSQGALFDGQGFCWNPTIAGTKSEQTFLVTASGPVPVTAGRSFPLVTVRLGDKRFERPAILQK
ncbi:MAG: aminopeptidase P family protein [Spirochaetales bacterium]